MCESKGGRFQESVSDPKQLPLDSLFLQAMASCHSLIKLKGELTGNPLDVKLFEAIRWDLKEQHNMGVNPDYGLATPTLVSPPKGQGAAAGGPLGHRSSNGGSASAAAAGAAKTSNLEIALLKTYPFDSAVQRMTVVAKRKGAPNFEVFVKGAPEKVASLCKPETSKS